MSEPTAKYTAERSWDDIIADIEQHKRRLRQPLADEQQRNPMCMVPHNLAEEIDIADWLLGVARDVAQEQRDREQQEIKCGHTHGCPTCPWALGGDLE